MALFALALVGGAVYAGIRYYRQRSQKRRTLVAQWQNAASKSAESMQDFLHQVDARYQTFVQTYLDPLLEGQTRRQQMELLTADTQLQVNDVLVTTDVALNRYLGASLGLMGVAALSAWLFPPLLLVTAAGAIALNWTVYVGAYRALRERKPAPAATPQQ